MNQELVKQLYQQSTNTVAATGESVAWKWEEAFARAIVLECSRVAKLASKSNAVCDAIEDHFGLSTPDVTHDQLVQRLVTAASDVCSTLEHPTHSVNAPQMWRLRAALDDLSESLTNKQVSR